MIEDWAGTGGFAEVVDSRVDCPSEEALRENAALMMKLEERLRKLGEMIRVDVGGRMTGWICPRCGRAWSPTVRLCDFCGAQRCGPSELKCGGCDGK